MPPAPISVMAAPARLFKNAPAEPVYWSPIFSVPLSSIVPELFRVLPTSIALEAGLVIVRSPRLVQVPKIVPLSQLSMPSGNSKVAPSALIEENVSMSITTWPPPEPVFAPPQVAFPSRSTCAGGDGERRAGTRPLRVDQQGPGGHIERPSIIVEGDGVGDRSGSRLGIRDCPRVGERAAAECPAALEVDRRPGVIGQAPGPYWSPKEMMAPRLICPWLTRVEFSDT